jgi:hypothetical protein
VSAGLAEHGGLQYVSSVRGRELDFAKSSAKTLMNAAFYRGFFFPPLPGLDTVFETLFLAASRSTVLAPCRARRGSAFEYTW